MTTSAKVILAALNLAAGLAVAQSGLAEPAVGAGTPFYITNAVKAVLQPGPDQAFIVTKVGPAAADTEVRSEPANATEDRMYAVPKLTFTASRGTLVFSFWDDPQHGARLKLENGLKRWIIYSAVIVPRGSTAELATTICSVAPGEAAFEAWSQDLASIRITGIYDSPKPSKLCGYADRGQLSPPPQRHSPLLTQP